MAASPMDAPAAGRRKHRSPWPRDPVEEKRYPTSAGLALQGTSSHTDATVHAYEALNRRFRDRDDLCIALFLSLYYRSDGVEKCLIPDLFVAFDVGRKPRRVYKVWEEGKVPDFVLEVSSVSTVDRDRGFKRDEYQRLGVREYWQLDTTGELLAKFLVGYRLEGGRFKRIRVVQNRDGREVYRSEVLGLELRSEWIGGGARLVLRDPLVGEDIPTGGSVDRQWQASDAARSAERRRRMRAEERARLAEERYRQLEAALRQATASKSGLSADRVDGDTTAETGGEKEDS